MSAVAGSRIIAASWATDVVYGVVAVPAALGVTALDSVALAVALTLFVLSIVVWGAAFAIAVARTARGDDVVVASLFFLQGSAPAAVRRQLFGALAAGLVVVAVTAVAIPFGVLVPMMSIGLVGLWAARHGTFPPRTPLSPR